MANTNACPSEQLSPDNAARIVLFDAMQDALESDAAFDGLDGGELFERVIPRLRVLVPRELHLQGEPAYVEAKIAACVEAGILQPHLRRPGLLLLGPRGAEDPLPGRAHHATTHHGLEAARERLDADEDRLRRGRIRCSPYHSLASERQKSDRYRTSSRLCGSTVLGMD